ncbi:MAG: O-acetylhomoserine aminocarboxypropyltransferase [Gammaproteobacteria bacterium]|nr:O-acetylhomoserine aminocarboxypropyltransferase [Gammaproteobacteria bacterium]MBI5616958.1 O-acetylhomoserine aminocarboxypropyltransferase [Gammaproteobacteria bacterium]
MSAPRYLGFDTLSLHAGQRPDPVTGSRAVPIHQTTSYVFKDAQQAAGLFDLARAGYIYSRIANPTVSVLEERLAALEGGVGAAATASGMAAIHLAVSPLVEAGAHIVSSRALYGGTHNLFNYTLPRFGVETTFVDPRDPESFRAAIRPHTKLVYAETIGNPRGEVLDIAAVAAVAHAAGLPLVIDSTLTPPALIRPFEHGADIVVHSLTKFIGGHGVAIGGAVIDSGQFDWEASGRFPTLTEPYVGQQNIDFCEEYGPAAYIWRTRLEGLRDFGATLSPTSAFQFLQGLETLSLRMRKHCENALGIAEFLATQDAVEKINYPGLPGHEDHALAAKLYPHGCGAVFSFVLKGGRAAGRKFIDALQLFSHLANVGDAKSLVIHPATTTHSRLDAEALAKAGIAEGLVRLSVGLEDIDDLIEDLAKALYRSQR